MPKSLLCAGVSTLSACANITLPTPPSIASFVNARPPVLWGFGIPGYTAYKATGAVRQEILDKQGLPRNAIFDLLPPELRAVPPGIEGGFTSLLHKSGSTPKSRGRISTKPLEDAGVSLCIMACEACSNYIQKLILTQGLIGSIVLTSSLSCATRKVH